MYKQIIIMTILYCFCCIIIDFLIAGVAGVSQLLKKAQLISIVKEIQQYDRAFSLFGDRYQALLGDMVNASTVWSTTVSGNGNGAILWSDEGYTFWQHLALAELINGKYDGTNL